MAIPCYATAYLCLAITSHCHSLSLRNFADASLRYAPTLRNFALPRPCITNHHPTLPSPGCTLPRLCIAVHCRSKSKHNDAKPSQCGALPFQCKSKLFLRFAEALPHCSLPQLRTSMPSLCWSMPPRCHSALSPYTATLCLCHSMFCPVPALRRCTYPRLRVSSQRCAVPELRKTKPLRGSSSLRCTHALLCIAPARLLSAQPRPRIAFPSRGYTKPKLVTALPIYAKALDSLSLRVNASALPVNAFRSNA